VNLILKKRLLRLVIITGAALLVGGVAAWFQFGMRSAQIVTVGSTQSESPLPIAGLNLGGPFSLTTHTGSAVTDATYNDRYKLIFFGFANCPGICQTELAKMTQTLKMLGPKSQKIAPLFITLDPEYDTPQVLSEFLKPFHPALIGLTGTRPQVDVISRSFRVYAQKVQSATPDIPMMDHSTFTYFMNPKGELQTMFRMEDTAAFIAKDIDARMAQDDSVTQSTNQEDQP
jgi:protein SCO1/2